MTGSRDVAETCGSSGTTSTVDPMPRSLLPTVLLLLSTIPASGEDWPCWLGPRRDGTSRERGWLRDWPAGGPPVRWEKAIGSGYSGIVVSGGHLLLFHRIDDRLRIDSLEPASGELQWSFSYETDFVDPYGYDAGPRCCPEIEDGRVFAMGPAGILHCLTLRQGRPAWRRDLRSEHELPPNFFGTGATPLVRDGVVYAHLGGPDRGTGMAFALDAASGRTRWKTRIDGGSYASPVQATIDGLDHLFVFHRGGLSAFDPASGRERWKYPWQSRNHYSVNAATPLVVGDLLLFTSTYRMGAVCLRIRKEGYEEVWKDDLTRRERILDAHWFPPIAVDGHVYGFAGRHPQGAALRCVELATGTVRWSWPGYLHRGSLLAADGLFIALGEMGHLALLELGPDGHRELSCVPRRLERPAWTVPTLSGGLLYLRDLKRLVCLDLRPRSDEEAGASPPTGAGSDGSPRATRRAEPPDDGPPRGGPPRD